MPWRLEHWRGGGCLIRRHSSDDYHVSLAPLSRWRADDPKPRIYFRESTGLGSTPAEAIDNALTKCRASLMQWTQSLKQEFPDTSLQFFEPLLGFGLEIIALSGYKGSGKDTVAKRLVGRHGFRRFAFADPLREALLQLDPYVDASNYKPATNPPYRRLSDALQEHESWDDLKKHPDVRGLLQRMGTEVCRNIIDQHCWVRLLLQSLLKLADPSAATPSRAVITDLRFPNELQALRMMGAVHIRVDRPDCKGDGHVSENLAALPEPDLVIDNSRSLEHLDMAVDTLMDNVVLRKLWGYALAEVFTGEY